MGKSMAHAPPSVINKLFGSVTIIFINNKEHHTSFKLLFKMDISPEKVEKMFKHSKKQFKFLFLSRMVCGNTYRHLDLELRK